MPRLRQKLNLTEVVDLLKEAKVPGVSSSNDLFMTRNGTLWHGGQSVAERDKDGFYPRAQVCRFIGALRMGNTP